MKFFVVYSNGSSKIIPNDKILGKMDARGDYVMVNDPLSLRTGDQIRCYKEHGSKKWSKMTYDAVIHGCDSDQIGPVQNIELPAPDNNHEQQADILAAIQQAADAQHQAMTAAREEFVETIQTTTTTLTRHIDVASANTTTKLTRHIDAAAANTTTTMIRRIDQRIDPLERKIEKINTDMERIREEKKVKQLKKIMQTRDIRQERRIVEQEKKIAEAIKILEIGMSEKKKLLVFIVDAARLLEQYRNKQPLYSVVSKDQTEAEARGTIAEYCKKKRSILILEEPKFAEHIPSSFDVILMIDAPQTIRGFLEMASRAGNGKSIIVLQSVAEAAAHQLLMAANAHRFPHVTSDSTPQINRPSAAAASNSTSAAATPQSQQQSSVPDLVGNSVSSVGSAASLSMFHSVSTIPTPPTVSSTHHHQQQQQLTPSQMLHQPPSVPMPSSCARMGLSPAMNDHLQQQQQATNAAVQQQHQQQELLRQQQLQFQHQLQQQQQQKAAAQQISMAANAQRFPHVTSDSTPQMNRPLTLATDQFHQQQQLQRQQQHHPKSSSVSGGGNGAAGFDGVPITTTAQAQLQQQLGFPLPTTTAVGGLSKLPVRARAMQQASTNAQTTAVLDQGVQGLNVNQRRHALQPQQSNSQQHMGENPRVPRVNSYPMVWQGCLGLENNSGLVQMHYVSGAQHLIKRSMPEAEEGSNVPVLRISQRMRLEHQQLEGVHRRMQLAGEHCVLVALPCDQNARFVMAYLNYQQDAGIVNVIQPGSNQTSHVVHIFPPCKFSEQHLGSAGEILRSIRDHETSYLFVVITTVVQVM